jgi:molecular chaperone HtpG
LRDPADLSLEQILAEVVNTEIFVSAKYPKHFFEVEMKSVTRYKSDLFLNVSALEDYLCQVAPVPFSSSFSFGAEIQDFLDKHAPNNTYSITLNGKPMFRPFRDSYELKPKLNGRFSKPEFFTIPANSAEVEAVGWILPSDYLGAIPERYGMHGFRLRVGNIQVGDARILDALFPQPRFNAWAVAECHVISPKIVPNARRDDFEHNNSYATLRNHLTPIAKAVLKACRQRSAERAKTRKLAAQRNNVNGHSLDWAQTRKFFLKNAKLRVSKRHTTALLKQLRNGGLTYSELIRSLIEPSNSHQIKHE